MQWTSLDFVVGMYTYRTYMYGMIQVVIKNQGIIATDRQADRQTETDRLTN